MTELHAVGDGPPVLVIHGGPGFDHGYLREPLLTFSNRRKIIFYDQIGCGRTPLPPEGPSLDGMGAQLADTLRRVFSDDRPTVLSHSWGCLVLASAVRLAGIAELSGLLVNPVPICRRDFDLSRAEFVSKIPPAVLAQASECAAKDATGVGVMRLLLPYYVHGDTLPPGLDLALSMQTYSTAIASLGEFDFDDTLTAMSRLEVLRGRYDITRVDHIRPLLAAVAAVHTIDAGHFPLHEAPVASRRVVDGVL